MSFDPCHLMQFTAAAKPRARRAVALRRPILELDRVTLANAVESDDGEIVPAGSTGTVVGIWAKGAAFEVEFAHPFSALATVRADAIGSHIPRR